MIFRRKKRFFTQLSATTSIIIVNVVVFILLFSALVYFKFVGSGLGDKMISFVALNPRLFVSGYFWTALSSVFVHFDPTHLLVNMLSLFFLGSFVERLIGRKRFVWFYIISGIVASLFFVGLAYLGQQFSFGASLFGTPSDFAVGASGAIFGLGAMLAVLLPRLRVLVFFVIPMPLWVAMAVLMFGLWAISAGLGLPIGNTAHFGGLICGLIFGSYLRIKYARKVDMLRKVFR